MVGGVVSLCHWTGSARSPLVVEVALPCRWCSGWVGLFRLLLVGLVCSPLVGGGLPRLAGDWPGVPAALDGELPHLSLGWFGVVAPWWCSSVLWVAWPGVFGCCVLVVPLWCPLSATFGWVLAAVLCNCLGGSRRFVVRVAGCGSRPRRCAIVKGRTSHDAWVLRRLARRLVLIRFFVQPFRFEGAVGFLLLVVAVPCGCGRIWCSCRGA